MVGSTIQPTYVNKGKRSSLFHQEVTANNSCALSHSTVRFEDGSPER